MYKQISSLLCLLSYLSPALSDSPSVKYQPAQKFPVPGKTYTQWTFQTVDQNFSPKYNNLLLGVNKNDFSETIAYSAPGSNFIPLTGLQDPATGFIHFTRSTLYSNDTQVLSLIGPDFGFGYTVGLGYTFPTSTVTPVTCQPLTNNGIIQCVVLGAAASQKLALWYGEARQAAYTPIGPIYSCNPVGPSAEVGSPSYRPMCNGWYEFGVKAIQNGTYKAPNPPSSTYEPPMSFMPYFAMQLAGEDYADCLYNFSAAAPYITGGGCESEFNTWRLYENVAPLADYWGPALLQSIVGKQNQTVYVSNSVKAIPAPKSKPAPGDAPLVCTISGIGTSSFINCSAHGQDTFWCRKLNGTDTAPYYWNGASDKTLSKCSPDVTITLDNVETD